MPAIKSLNLGEDNERVYDDLIVAVEASDEVLSLLLAVCDETQLRDEIIQRYEVELQASIRPYQVALSRKEPSLREAIAEVTKNDSYLQSGGKAVITVTGADRLLSRRLGEERSEKEIFFGYLQWTRESLREYPYPIILWLTNPLLTELSRKAPDFWSWRKDVFRFSADEIHVGLVSGDKVGGDKISSSVTPINLDQSRGWQTKVDGDTAYIVTFHFSNGADSLPKTFSLPKTLVLPETIENDSIPPEDLQRLINQTDQQQGSDSLLATLYSKLGRAYASRVKIDEIEASQATIEQAIECLQKATRVQETLGIIVDLAKNLSWLGYLYELEGNYAEAEPILQQALTILEQQLGSNHPSVANTLHNLSVSYVLQGRYTEATSLLQQKSLSIPNNLPYSGTPRFIGRETELAQLHEQLQRSDRIAISAIAGMGGIGKTELALQYALKNLGYGTYSGGVCWVRAHQDIGVQILAFARSYLNLEPPGDLDLVAKVGWCWWHWHQGEVLVIFDDVTDFSAIQSFLPPTDPRFKVLLTTRLQLGASVNQVFLYVLPDSEALEFLRSIVGDERTNYQLEDAQALCAWLGYLPLALELAARYLASRPDLSVKSLLDRLQRQKLAAKALARPEVGMTANLGIAAAFELSWHALSEPEQQLAGWLSLFALAPIPWPLVQDCFPDADEEELEDWRDNLVALHLLQRLDAEGEQCYQLHRLLREFFAIKVNGTAHREDLAQRLCQVMVTVSQQIPETPTLNDIAAVAPAIPHLAETATTLKDSLSDEDLIWPFVGLARFYDGQGLYGDAEPWYEEGLAISRVRLGDEHPSVAQSLNNLAGLYDKQGRYSEAEPLYQEALAMRKRLLGDEHPSVAQSLNNLAGLYDKQGRYSEAEPLFQEALAMWKRLLGDEHPSVATSLNNLALLYNNQGRYSEAEPLFQEALAMNKRLLGDEHPDVASSLNNLALLYKNQGRYSEAEPLFQEALAMNKRLLGNEHPDVASSLNNLAALYDNQGRYSEAEPLYQEALALYKRLLGDEHPDVARSLNNLAFLYKNQGRYSEAEPLYQEALAMRKRLLGNEHPSVASSLNNLAGLYNNQGRYSEAEPRLQEALALYKRLLGDEHPDVALSLNNLAGLYKNQGRYSEAEPLYQEALAMNKRLLGDEHPDVAQSLNNLAFLYYNQGRYSEAEPLLQEALAMNKRLLGDEHPSVATSLNNLALLYDNQGRYSEAEPLLQEALAMSKRLLGDEHPDVALSLNNLAGLYDNQGRYSEAEPLYQEALAMWKRLLGNEHPSVATSLNNLALLYDNQGRYSEAEPLYQEALALFEKLLGSDHPSTNIVRGNLQRLQDRLTQ
ncbi:FxSxx-COOH system tetratricopeptide repeat protein [Leptothoe sp. PORK10 BA2]|uniref:FxSxx-COOH system tetratricopeptide repeat protein n=1 Tax=Leptothoe sp. PORK10 BA2 TaxID=3110254 RepID=UPI002B1F624E|nr:FxSxx-COOH system tetratricopeptide repeat protein [Leptothoe sp. PORK10 BA2]MEA5466841.1 FxSxx-COOH system tetratricopeptide repeat protein [Leptothoe sp. PORK10 BA2]